MDKFADSVSLFKKYAEEHDLGEFRFVQQSPMRDDVAVHLTIRSGRGEHQIKIVEPLIQRYIDVDFAQYKFFHEYLGIVSYDKGCIEAEIDSVGERLRHLAIDRILGLPMGTRRDDSEPQPIEFGNDAAGEVYAIIGAASETFRLLLAANESYDRLPPRRILAEFLEDSSRPPARILTLRIENLRTQRFSEAERLLKSISDSCFFYLSREFQIDLQLRGVQRRMYRRRMRRPQESLPQPSHEYPSEAMSFYRYGLSAQNMPLLQFLAFYQVVEFFFNHYSMLEVQNLAVNRLKDPKFSAYDVRSVQDLIRLIKDHRASDSTRNEREQLKAVLTATVHPSEIIGWVTEDEERAEFFRTRAAFKRTSDKPLDITKPDGLILQLTERIYDIRCRIVHTKSSGIEQDFILPYSQEALHLLHDIDLMQEVAERVLIASSSELRIPTTR